MATAIYIEYPRITAVVVGGSAKKPRIKRVVVGELAEARTEDGNVVVDYQKHLADEVARFVKENKIGAGKHLLLIGPEAMRYRDLRLAFTDTRQIDRVIDFQVEGLIPSIPIEDLAISYVVLQRDESGSRLLVAAADVEYVRRRIEALESAGVRVDVVDCHLSGTLNLGLLHPELAATTPTALWLDFAGTTATVAIVDEGKVLTTRVFLSPYLAGASGATAIADDVKERARELEAIALEHRKEVLQTESVQGLPVSESVNIGAEEVASRIQNMSREELAAFVKRVAIESRRTTMMTQLEVSPERLVVSGLGAEGGTIAALIAAELRFEKYSAIDLMDSVRDEAGAPDDEWQDLGELTYLTGVAIKGLGRDFTGMDFRRGKLSAGSLFDYAKTPLAFTATLVLLFAGLMLLVVMMNVQRLKSSISTIRNQPQGPAYYHKRAFAKAPWSDDDANLKKMEKKERKYAQFPDEPAEEISGAHLNLKKVQARLEGATTTQYPEPHRADEILAAVLKALKDAKPSYEFAVQSITIRKDVVSLLYYVSTDEDEQERKNGRESQRMSNALTALTESRPEWFSRPAKQVSEDKPFTTADGRNVNAINMLLSLRKRKEPKKPKSTRGGRRR